MLVWTVDAIAGFDTAWVGVEGDRLFAEGQQSGLAPRPYWVRYELETGADFVTAHVSLASRWDDGSALLDIRRDAQSGWTVDGKARPDLAQALDVDLAGCPLTNTMPVLRHGLHRGPGDHELVMAFIEVPSLRVVPARQRYTHVRSLPDLLGGGAVVRFRSGSFQSDLTFDADGFVIDYPQLGRRLGPGERGS